MAKRRKYNISDAALQEMADNADAMHMGKAFRKTPIGKKLFNKTKSDVPEVVKDFIAGTMLNTFADILISSVKIKTKKNGS